LTGHRSRPDGLSAEQQYTSSMGRTRTYNVVRSSKLDEFAFVLSKCSFFFRKCQNAANQEVSADGPKKCDALVPSQAHEAQ
jgi:hypothetical protein